MPNELEKLLNEHSLTREAATSFMESRQDERSSVTSDILTIDIIEHMNIWDTNKKEVGRQQALPQTEQEVNTVYTNKKKIVKGYDQEIPQSQTADNPMAPPGELDHHETPGRQIKQSNQLCLPHQDDCNTSMDIK